jgi:ankyrin repeat protein
MSIRRDIFDAAGMGTVEDVRYFLEEKGVYIDTKNNLGQTSLHHASYYVNIEVVKFLVSKGAYIEARDHQGFTPLHCTAFSSIDVSKRVETAQFLVSKGANVNVRTNEGNTPVDLAIKENCLEVANYLESAGGKRKNTKSSGCYIATAVYGSYDCPQVWILRRYRDNTLANNILGRLFIRAYYSIGPIIVKTLGNARWFTAFSRSRLDKFVHQLQENGYENTPYND